MEKEALARTLKEHLQWNKARIDFISHFILVLLKYQTCVLSRLAQRMGPNFENQVKRIYRFFAEFEIPQETFARLVLSITGLNKKKIVLIMDRTNWRFGLCDINILALCVAFNGVSLPLFWLVLTHKGNSSQSQRILLIDRFLKCFGNDCIDYFVADREFIGKEWLIYLRKKLRRFVVRIRENQYIPNSRGINKPAKILFRNMSYGQTDFLRDRKLYGINFQVVGHKSHQGYMILLSTLPVDETISAYKTRWQIENLFGCLKTRGFDLEATHLTHPDRIAKLVAILGLAVTWCLVIGEWKNQLKPIKLKTHGRLAKSIFRLGLDHLANVILLVPNILLPDFKIALKKLSST